MKLRTTNEVESTITGADTKSFQIDANGKAFRILLDGIYSNKPRAAIRELMTNAYDSHIDAGIPSIPFDVHIPSRLDPTFRVRDYGVSLSHDDVMGLYSTLFRSSKDQSNTAVGMLGLGSKAPFAYTDSFTVVARLNGEKRTYLAAMAGDGTPQITLLGRESSDEAQGLEVAFAVDAQDFDLFRDEVRALSIGFDPVPNADGVEVTTPEPLWVGADGEYAVFPKGSIPGGGKLNVRQGCVIYPVNESILSSPVDRLLGWDYCVVLNVPIGSVSVTASRESLSLDADTHEAVRASRDAFMDEVKATIQAEVDACPNRLKAQEYWFGANSYNSIFDFTPNYRGHDLNHWIDLKGGGDWEPPRGFHANSREASQLKRFNFARRSHLRFVIFRTGPKVLRSTLRYRAFVETRRNSDVFKLVDPTPRQLERLTTLLGLEPEQIVSVAALPDPGPPERVKREKAKISGVYTTRGGCHYRPISDESEIPDKFYWVQVDRVSQRIVSDANYKLAKMVAIGFPRRDLLFFTNKATEVRKPSVDSVLHTCVSEWENQHKSGLFDSLVDHYVAQELGAHAAALGVVKPAGVGQDMVNGCHTAFGWGWMDQARGEANRRLAALKQKYPLLFGQRPTDDHVAAYIELCNESA